MNFKKFLNKHYSKLVVCAVGLIVIGFAGLLYTKYNVRHYEKAKVVSVGNKAEKKTPTGVPEKYIPRSYSIKDGKFKFEDKLFSYEIHSVNKNDKNISLKVNLTAKKDIEAKNISIPFLSYVIKNPDIKGIADLKTQYVTKDMIKKDSVVNLEYTGDISKISDKGNGCIQFVKADHIIVYLYV